tara:strand:- start:2559 stop:3182 length:624 start_codon:yes stop_codon:yes gene_type:complete
MPSKVDLANESLRLLGATRITAFDNGTKNANVVTDLYDETRLELLQFPWNFAGSRVKLAQLLAAPAFGFDHAYALPADWVYTVSAHNNDAGSGTILYREELQDDQNVLVSNADDIYLRYVFNLEDPNRMSAKFRKALVATLARDMCIAITNSNTLEEKLEDRAKKALRKAKSSDGIQSFPEQRPTGSWRNSRNGGGRTNGNDMNFSN